jgi:hypothetical protein
MHVGHIRFYCSLCTVVLRQLTPIKGGTKRLSALVQVLLVVE